MTLREFSEDKTGKPVLCRDCHVHIKMVSEDDGKTWKPRALDGSEHRHSTPDPSQQEIVREIVHEETKILPIDILAPLDVDKLAGTFKTFEDFKNRLLSADDSVQIQNKRFLKKSAWRKWALACGVSDELVSNERVPAQGLDESKNFYYRVIVRAFHNPTGRSAIGVAVASLNEKKNWAHPEHDVFSLCHTRAKSRAISDLVGGGEVSAEEMQAE